LNAVLGDNNNLTKLNNILSAPEITEKFKNGLSLEESDDLINISENSFTQGLRKSLSELKKVREYSYKLKHGYSDDNKEFSLIFIKSSDSSNDKPFLNFSVISGLDRILLSFVKLLLSPKTLHLKVSKVNL
jgi:hypothetical protein